MFNRSSQMFISHNSISMKNDVTVFRFSLNGICNKFFLHLFTTHEGYIYLFLFTASEYKILRNKM